ncbi:MAG: hypothetical protein WCG80_15460, partial [Spirochaetales bacterium]
GQGPETVGLRSASDVAKNCRACPAPYVHLTQPCSAGVATASPQTVFGRCPETVGLRSASDVAKNRRAVARRPTSTSRGHVQLVS